MAASSRSAHGAATYLSAFLALCLLVAAEASLGSLNGGSGVDPRGLLALPVHPRKLLDDIPPVQQHQRNLLGVGSSTGVVKWKLSECDISKSDEVTCTDTQANACCDGSGCASWANNRAVKCAATRFIGCCGTEKSRSAVDWSLSTCTVKNAAVYTQGSLPGLGGLAKAQVQARLLYRSFGLLPLLRAPRVTGLLLRGAKKNSQGERQVVGRLVVQMTATFPHLLEAGVVGSSVGHFGRWIACSTIFGQSLSARNKAVSVLGSCSPALPAAVTERLSRPTRTAFSPARLNHHIRRLQAVAEHLPKLELEAIRSWQRPAVNVGLLVASWLLCFQLRQTLLLGMTGLVVLMINTLVQQVLTGLQGTELEDLDPGPTEGKADESSLLVLSDSGISVDIGPSAGDGHGWVQQSGVRCKLDLASRHGTGLTVQNNLDDLATAAEKLLAALSGIDAVATSLVYAMLLLVVVAVAVAGPGQQTSPPRTKAACTDEQHRRTKPPADAAYEPYTGAFWMVADVCPQ
eukprot:gene10944-11098_t